MGRIDNKGYCKLLLSGVELADLRCYTASMLYRDLILVTSVESEVLNGYATSVIRKLGITNEGKLYLEEISE